MKKVWYNITLTEFMDNEDGTKRLQKNQQVLAKVKSKGLAYIVLQEFKKIYQNTEEQKYNFSLIIE